MSASLSHHTAVTALQQYNRQLHFKAVIFYNYSLGASGVCISFSPSVLSISQKVVNSSSYNLRERIGLATENSLADFQVVLHILPGRCIIILLQKIQKMANKDMTFGYHPAGAPTSLCKQEVGKPSRNTAQPYARVQGYVNDDLRTDGLQKGCGFRVGTWNVDSLTGRAGEVVEALSDRKVDVACIQMEK